MKNIKSCVLAIGNELLSGHTLDTNSHAAAQMLTSLGTEVFKIMACDDAEERIHSGVVKCQSRVLIVSGGLGKTHDDVTNKVIEQVEKEYGYQRREIENRLGTANGVILNDEKKMVFFLPGVPYEFLGMLPEVKRIIQEEVELPKKHSKSFMTLGVGEFKLWEETGLLEKIPKGISVSSLPRSPGVEIIISIPDEENNSEKFEEASTAIREELEDYIYSENGESLISTVSNLLKEQKKTISLAESCTGGLLAKNFTDISGSSDYFTGGIVCYSNAIKEDFLDVNPETIEQYGAVSSETAEELAANVREIMNTDYGISITGIAGPDGGTETKPVGLVYIGLATKTGVSVAEYRFTKNRETNRQFTAEYALKLLYDELTLSE